MADKDLLDEAFERIAIDDEGRACRDIPESACREEPQNFFKHVGSLSLTKSADGLIDPKLVLSWLLTHLGAPTALIGALVPIREAGALLPQMFTAAKLRALPKRKWAWSAASLGQGLAVLFIAVAALLSEGALAGWLILGGLTFFALARSVASVTYKDVLGKTVGKARRGSATGLASSIAATTTILFAVLLFSEVGERRTLVIGALFVAAAAWVAAALLFSTLREEAGATEGGANGIDQLRENLALLSQDPQLRRFILTRGLLTATALAPPFMVAAASAGSRDYGGLGLLILASAGASLVSGLVWGRLSDNSSKKVLVLSAMAAALILTASAAAGFAGWLQTWFVLPGLLFVLMIAYEGVRVGRSTHLVDMASEETRAAYTALSNTIIGLILIAGGGFGVVADLASPEWCLALMAAMCAAAVPAALALEDVQQREGEGDGDD